VAILEQRYHLNETFFVQYWYWLSNALHGNLGISITLRENVSSLIASRIWTTAGLVAYASVLIVIFGIGLGVLSGLRRGIADTGTLVVTAISAAIPGFVAAIVLILLFAVELGWFPALGNGTGLVSNLRHFTLPAVALAISSLAIVARVTRASVRTESQREHVQTAVSRGIPARQLIRRHVLRNAAIPITTITGITIAGWPRSGTAGGGTGGPSPGRPRPGTRTRCAGPGGAGPARSPAVRHRCRPGTALAGAGS
jgi:peptide/nickel transport system permease protein